MAFVGCCDEMCPEEERNLRRDFKLSFFERDGYEMVKEYRRAGADQKEPSAADLRTPAALEKTIDYLVFNIVEAQRTPELELDWYDFLWDRLRAIRKDITQQNICDKAAAEIVERCARFHVHSCYAMNRVPDFDPDMNKRNLNDCLQMLRQMYTDIRLTGEICPGESEFQKYDILLHLDEDHLSSTVLMKTSDHRSSQDMRFITRIFNAYTNNDYYRFFKLFRQADYMTSCILSLYVNKMRASGLKTIAATNFQPRQPVTWYPVDLLIDAFEFDDLNDVGEFMSAFGIGIHQKDSKYYISLTKELVGTIRQSSLNLSAVKSRKLVEFKANDKSIGELIYGTCRYLPERRSEDAQVDQMDIWEDQAVNEVDTYESDSRSTQLVVGPGNVPKLTSRLQDVTVYVGQSLEFRVNSTGLPPIDSCQWFKDDELLIELDSTKTSRKTIRSSASERISMAREEEEAASGKEEDKVIIFRLCIDNLKLDDTGRYKCRINNQFGYDESECFVKVLQEIIEEHEEVEETIEETMRLGGGKKSTREEEEQVVVGEEEQRDVEMVDESGAVRTPRFRRRLSDRSVLIEEDTTVIASELVVSTERDEWSDSEELLKVRWSVDDVEIARRDSEHSIADAEEEGEEEEYVPLHPQLPQRKREIRPEMPAGRFRHVKKRLKLIAPKQEIQRLKEPDKKEFVLDTASVAESIRDEQKANELFLKLINVWNKLI